MDFEHNYFICIILCLQGKGTMTTHWLYRARHINTHVTPGLMLSDDQPHSSTFVDTLITSPDLCDEVLELEFIRPKYRPSKLLSKQSLPNMAYNFQMSDSDAPKTKGSCGESSYKSSCSTSGWQAKNAALPTYEDLEREFSKNGSPPIIQLTEGVHY